MATSDKTAATSQPFYYSWRVAFWAVLALSFILYIPSLGNSPVWDDTQILSGEAIGGNSIVGAITQPFLHGYFRPLVSLTLQAENAAFQGNTFFYHLVNVLLHAGGCAAFMALLLAAVGSRRAAVLGGIGMAIHPALVSTVAWIGGITDALATLLVLLFLLTMVLAAKAEPSRQVRYWAASVAFYMAALFCKEQTIALLPLVPVAIWAFGDSSQKVGLGRSFRALVPYLGATLVFALLWKTYFPGYHPATQSVLERIQTIGQSLVHYALVIVLPLPKFLQTYTLGFYEGAGWTSAIGGFALLGLGTGLIGLARRSSKALAFFGLLTLLYILPVANIIPPPSLVVAPYRAGLAVVGFCAIVAILIAPRLEKQWAAAVAGGYLFLWTALAWVALPAWSDNRTLFASIAEADPSFLLARRNLARNLMMTPPEATADKAEAVSVLEGALTDLYGSQEWRRPDAAMDLVKADSRIQRRLRANKGPMAPEVWLSELFTQLGEARAQTGDLPGSQAAFRSALGARPTNFTATMALAQIAAQSGDVASARSWLEAAQKLKPDDPNISQMIQALPADSKPR